MKHSSQFFQVVVFLENLVTAGVGGFPGDERLPHFAKWHSVFCVFWLNWGETP
jgi:hypothetical protein